MTFSEEIEKILSISRFDPLFDYLEYDIVNKADLLNDNSAYTKEEIDALLIKVKSLREPDYDYDSLTLLSNLIKNNNYLASFKITELLKCRDLLISFYTDYRQYRKKKVSDPLDDICSGILRTYKSSADEYWRYYFLLTNYLKFHDVEELGLSDKQKQFIMVAVQFSMQKQQEEFADLISTPMTYFGSQVIKCDNGSNISNNIIKINLDGNNARSYLVNALDTSYNIEDNPISSGYVNDLISLLSTSVMTSIMPTDVFEVLDVYNKLKYFNMVEMLGIIDSTLLHGLYCYVCDFFSVVTDMDLFMFICNYTTCRVLSMYTMGTDKNICDKFQNDMYRLISRYNLNKFNGGDKGD